MNKEELEYGEYYKQFFKLWENSMMEVFDVWKKNASFKNKVESEKNDEFDSASYYTNFYDAWEKVTTEALEKWVNSPLFASNIGKIIEKSSEFKKYFDQAMEISLKNMNLPSKRDLERVLSSINNIEAKINDLSDKVDEILISKKSNSKK